MASSKYAAHKSMVKVLKYLFDLPKPKTKTEALRELEITNSYQLMYYLRKNDFIRTKNIYNKPCLEITNKGIKKLKRYDFDNLEIPKQEKWDGMWRLVFFDIPDKHKTARNCLTLKLKEIGFKSIQKSVYIHPYPCFDQIELIRSTYSIRSYVFFATISELEGHEKLKTLFKI